MGRITGTSTAYAHAWYQIDADTFRVAWTVDRKVFGSRLRYPTRFTRETDRLGAVRFSKRHGLQAPAEAAS